LGSLLSIVEVLGFVPSTKKERKEVKKRVA
jgi:hypothetical protein